MAKRSPVVATGQRRTSARLAKAQPKEPSPPPSPEPVEDDDDIDDDTEEDEEVASEVSDQFEDDESEEEAVLRSSIKDDDHFHFINKASGDEEEDDEGDHHQQNEDDDDEDDDSINHSDMLKRLLKNSKYADLEDQGGSSKFKWQSKRTGVGREVSEHAMSKDAKSKLRLSTLLKVSKNADAKRKMRNFEEKAVMAAPLKKPLAQKAARRVNFEAVSTEIAKYDPLVKELRSAEQVVFPRNDEALRSLRMTVAGQFGGSLAAGRTEVDLQEKMKKKVSSLEAEITEQLVLNEENVELDSRPLTENELAILQSKSVEEARALHREIQRRRLLTSYQEARFRRLRRIKSKKYHRILKKERLKGAVEALEATLEAGEEGAEEKLAELDKLRALERASLKHHSTGKWAKYSKLRAKYDDATREQLNIHMALNAELMKKRSLAVLEEFGGGDRGEDDDDVDRLILGGESESSNKDVIEGVHLADISLPNDYNPWISKVGKVSAKAKLPQPPPSIPTKDPDNSAEKFFARRVRARMEADEKAQKEVAFREDALDEANIVESTSFSAQDVPNLRAPNDAHHNQHHQNKPEPEVEANSKDETSPGNVNLKLDSLIVSAEDVRTKKGKLVKNGEGEEVGDHDEGDDEGHQTMGDFDFTGGEMQRYLREAFIDDDVVQDFLKEKKEAEKGEKEVSASASAYLPGWGNWAGGGIAENRRRRQRVLKKTVTRDRKLGTAIANAIILKNDKVEEVGKKFKIAFKPASVPNVAAFQATLAKPVGASWNPQSVFKSMTAPKVITKAGAIIRPMAPTASKDQELKGTSGLKGTKRGMKTKNVKSQGSKRKSLR